MSMNSSKRWSIDNDQVQGMLLTTFWNVVFVFILQYFIRKYSVRGFLISINHRVFSLLQHSKSLLVLSLPYRYFFSHSPIIFFWSFFDLCGSFFFPLSWFTSTGKFIFQKKNVMILIFGITKLAIHLIFTSGTDFAFVFQIYA